MIRVIDNFINKEQLKKIDEIIKNSKPEDGLATTSLNSTYYKKNTQYFSNKELWETILSKNVCYFIQENVSCSTFYPGQIMVSEYNKSDFYEDHVDNAFLGTRARKISFSIFLDDEKDYRGGELIIKHENGESKFKEDKGAAVFYPSNYIHQVTEITKGKRRVVVGWIDCLVPKAEDRFILTEAKKYLLDLDKFYKELLEEDKTRALELRKSMIGFRYMYNELYRKCMSER